MSLKTFLEQKIPEKWKGDFRLGGLDKAIAALNELKVEPRHHLKSGSTCVVFDYGDEVVKLCTKKIIYYREFRENLKQFVDTRFREYFMPINRMVYEDSHYFIYTQGKIRVLDYSEVNRDVFIYTLRMIQIMIREDAFTPDLISSNFGWSRDGHLYMLDYHDLKRANHYLKKNSWSKVIRCLMEFACLMTHREPFERKFSQSWLPWKDDDYIRKQDYGRKYFGRELEQVFKTFYTGDKNKIIQEIDTYIKYLISTKNV